MCVFDNLNIKHIYSNPYYPQGNGKIENVHNLIKCTIAKFTYDSQLEWDDTPLSYLLLQHHPIHGWSWVTILLST